MPEQNTPPAPSSATPSLSLSLIADAPTPRTGCWSCKHLTRETESWEMPNVYWYECTARPQNSNLRAFPFSTTTCDKREAASS